MDKPGRVRFDLLDACGDRVGEPVDIFLYHQTFSETVAVRDVRATKPILVGHLRATPQGHYRVLVDPPSYLPISFFVNVPASRPLERSLHFAVDPDKVLRAKFPQWAEVEWTHSLLKASPRVLGYAGATGQALYEAVDDIRRAGLLNILAKVRRTPLAGGGVVLDGVRELRELRGDRFFATVTHELREQVKNSIAAGLFHEVSGALHRPPDGFSPAGSYKTPDRYGNLQLTFFAAGQDWVADIDIDDAAGLEHVFQVARNHLTGRPTHPYSIRDILLRHQEIDPGYRFVLREETAAPRAAAARRG